MVKTKFLVIPFPESVYFFRVGEGGMLGAAFLLPACWVRREGYFFFLAGAFFLAAFFFVANALTPFHE